MIPYGTIKLPITVYDFKFPDDDESTELDTDNPIYTFLYINPESITAFRRAVLQKDGIKRTVIYHEGDTDLIDLPLKEFVELRENFYRGMEEKDDDKEDNG